VQAALVPAPTNTGGVTISPARLVEATERAAATARIERTMTLSSFDAYARTRLRLRTVETTSEGPEEIEDRLLVRSAELEEVLHDRIGLGGRILALGPGEMGLDGDQEVAGPPVVQEEQALPDAPEWLTAELVRSRRALDDVVGKARTHVMHEQIRKEVHRPVFQHRTDHGRRGLHLRRVAQVTTGAAEELSASLRAGARRGIRFRCIHEAHHDLELHPIRQDVLRIVEPLIAAIVCRRAGDIVRRRLTRPVAIRILLGRRREELVRDTHLDVVRLGGEDRDRLVLGLPPEARDRAVVAAPVGVARGAARPQALRSVAT